MALPELTSSATLLGQLERQIAAQNAACYWPGPWTLDGERAQQLVGRDEDIGELVYLIRDKSLTVLSGDSGVGKSSLLLAGLIPALRVDGYKALVCRDWRDDRSEEERARGLDGVSHFLAEKFAADLAELQIAVPDPDNLVTHLDAAYGSEVVIILDQFEEVIRQQPELFAHLCDWVEAVAENSQLRVLISLRSEYAHHLAELDVSAYRREDQTIPALRAEQLVRKVILSGAAKRNSPAAGDEVITDSAASLIVDQWVAAGAHVPRSRVRLLHLQAFLYSLWTRQPSGAAITESDVRAFLDEAQDKARKHSAQKAGFEGLVLPAARELAIGVFDWALANVVGVHVELCGDFFDEIRQGSFVDLPLREGVLSSLVRLAEHLSSGGYKVEQEEVHLAELVLANELRTLGFFDDSDGDDDPEAVAFRIIHAFADLTGRTDFDWASATTKELEAQLHEINPKVAEVRLHRSGVTAGALMGTSPKLVLIEECRRFFIALHWLRIGALVRSSPSDEGRNFVALSHDGFGRGLNEWADANDARPETALYAITAAFGKAFNWPTAREADPEVNPLFRSDDGRPRLFVNLRWRSCRVIGTSKSNLHIRNVVFMNCDFRGTSFQRCTLQGVTFINCLMDGVQFEDCRILGRATALEAANPASTAERDLPSFLWDDQNDVVATLNHYQFGLPEAATKLFSETSGQSVRVVEVVDAQSGVNNAEHQITESEVTALAEKQRGGLVLYGGRLSSLAFYRCDFDQAAEVSLRYVAGTSLDFFEHEGGRVELFDVALRGVTISPPITASLEGERAIHVEFEAVDSHLENVWFSSGLEGSAEIKNSIVWQLFNGSQATDGGFTVLVDGESPHLGVVNVPADQVLGPPMAVIDPADAENWYKNAIRKFGGRIDYRSPEENKAYRELMGDEVDELTAEETAER